MNPDSIQISAVIPTFERASLLHRAVRSVLAQTHRNLRVIVCDNASSDRTQEVVQEIMAHDCRVEYHRHERNIGALANFQHAFASPRSPWFSFLSDDDLLLPDFYARAAAALAAEPGARAYMSQCYTCTLSTGRARLRPRKLWSSGLHAAGLAAPKMLREHFTWTSCVFATDLRQQLGELDPVHVVDLLWLTRVAATVPFIVDLVPGAIFVEHGGNVSSNTGLDAQLRSLDAAIRMCDNADPGTVPVDDLRAAVRELFEGVGRNAVRTATITGNSQLASQAGSFLQRVGSPAPRQLAQAKLVAKGGLSSRVGMLVMGLKARVRAISRSLRARESIESLLARHANPATVAWITQPLSTLPLTTGTHP
jgi:glycosyltransferase involved in cell wall biosynthesis